MAKSRYQQVRFVLGWVLVLNLSVAFAKLGYGLRTASLGLQADGFHSLFDGISNIIGLLGLWLASSPADHGHPYGHKKFETLAAAGIGGMLLSTCAYLLWRSYEAWQGMTVPRVTVISFVIMGITMMINGFVTKWEQRKGKELSSEILLADSYHTASDVLTSFSVIGGLIAIQLGYPLFDPLIALFIAGVIAWTALKVFRGVIASLTDEVRLDPEKIRSIAITIPGILHCHEIRTRGLPDHIFVDLAIHVAPDLPLENAHALSHQVEQALKTQIQGVEDVVIHLEPEGH